MTTKSKRTRNYTPEFRADAVRLVLEQGRSVADVARGLDVHVNTLHTWVHSARQHGLPWRDGGHPSMKRSRGFGANCAG